MHSDIDTLERLELLRDLRAGVFDALVGINLLREGLDLPEVSLVAILDADREGFLRSPRSLIQTIGRASRNVNGQVIMYADRVTRAMQYAIDETERRRALQTVYNAERGITPQTVKRSLQGTAFDSGQADYLPVSRSKPGSDPAAVAEALRSEMLLAAESLDFERAAKLRDQLHALKANASSKRTQPTPQKSQTPRKRR